MAVGGGWGRFGGGWRRLAAVDGWRLVVCGGLAVGSGWRLVAVGGGRWLAVLADGPLGRSLTKEIQAFGTHTPLFKNQQPQYPYLYLTTVAPAIPTKPRNLPQEKNKTYQRGPKLEIDFRYTYFFFGF